MRVILDTNILISALLVPSGVPGAIYRAWSDGAFTLLLSEVQTSELRRTLAKPALTTRIRRYSAGRLVNDLRRFAEDVGPLSHVDCSPDPDDNFLLAMAKTGKADYLVTGDKSDLIALTRHAGTRIVSAREFLELLS